MPPFSQSLFPKILNSNPFFKQDPYSNEYFVLVFSCGVGVDTAENEPLKVHLIIQPWDFIFIEPPRPDLFFKRACGREREWRLARPYVETNFKFKRKLGMSRSFQTAR